MASAGRSEGNRRAVQSAGQLTWVGMLGQMGAGKMHSQHISMVQFLNYK